MTAQTNTTQMPPSRPLDGQSFTIGVLSITACVLFCAFLLVNLNPKPAKAIGMLDRVGDYVMFTHQASTSVEHLVVIDAAVKRMNVYNLRNRRQLELLQSVRLDQLPGAPEREQLRQQQKRRP